MQVLMTVKQPVELGATLEAAVSSLTGILSKGTSTATPAIEITIEGHVYSVTVALALVA